LTSFFSTIFQDHLRDNPTFFDTPQTVAAVFLPMAPVFSEGDPRYTGTDADTITELSSLLGWEPPIHWGDPPVQEVTLPLVATTSGSTRYVLLDSAYVLPDDAPSMLIRAVAFVYKGTIGGVITDPIIFVSNTPVGSSGMVLNPGDSITARPDATASNQRWLFSYTVNTGPPATVASVPGPLATLKAEPPFDASRTQHVWLYPQRVNLLANPSFEGGMTHWRTNGAMQQIDGAAPGGGVKAGQFSGASPLIVESNMFPTAFGVRPKEMLTVRLNAKGNGRMKVALLSWMADFLETRVDWGQMPDPTDPTTMIDAEWSLSPEGFIAVCSLRMTPEARYGMVRVEVEGDLLVLDNCLVEEGWVPAGQNSASGGTLSTGFPYFDGDSLYGARDDYSWYGGEDCQGRTYSCWYNHRRAVVGRLFAFQTSKEDQAQPPLPPTWTFDPTMYMQEHWFTAPPARVLNKLLDDPQTPVFLDACDSTDTMIANHGYLPALTATASGARRFAPENRSYFWIPASAGNSLSVPHATNLNITAAMTLIAEIAPASWTPAAEQIIASKWVPGANSWVFSVLPSGSLQFRWGTTTLFVNSDVNLAFTPASRHFVGFTFLNNIGGNAEIRFWHSDDGTTWTQLGSTLLRPSFSLASGTAKVEITAQNNAEATGSMEAKVYRFQIFNSTGSSGTVATDPAVKVLDIDTEVLTTDDYGEPTFPAATGQIVNVNRSTSGYISTMTPALNKGGRFHFMLDGINDYIEMGHDTTLNIPDNGNFVVVLTGRQKVMPKANSDVIQKVDPTAPNAGWEIATTPTAPNGGARPKFKDATTALSGAEQAFNVRKVPTSTGFRMTANKVVTLRDSAFTAPVDSTALGAITNTVPMRIGRSRADVYESFDFFGMAVLTQPLDDTELSNLAIAMRDASDVYHHGDRWTISADGIFMGIPLTAGDVLVATHPTGSISPMRFDQVWWDTEAEGGGVVTNIEIEKQGLVYKWLPSGQVVYHLDVLFPHDTRPCPPPVTGDPLSRDDVPDPWALPPAPDTEPPTAPPNLRVESFTSAQVDLAWDAATDNVGVVQYRIERAVGTGSTAFNQIFATSILTYSDIGLASSETYRYRVRAVDAAGNLGPYSNVVDVTTQSAP
jgi:hypothetical protein